MTPGPREGEGARESLPARPTRRTADSVVAGQAPAVATPTPSHCCGAPSRRLPAEEEQGEERHGGEEEGRREGRRPVEAERESELVEGEPEQASANRPRWRPRTARNHPCAARATTAIAAIARKRVPVNTSGRHSLNASFVSL
jgi:hypothetical protein